VQWQQENIFSKLLQDNTVYIIRLSELFEKAFMKTKKHFFMPDGGRAGPILNVDIKMNKARFQWLPH